jgi:hypothetical protein
MPPDPDHIEAEIETESGVHVLAYENGAVHFLPDRDDPETGVWLNNIDKQEVHGFLDAENPHGPREVEDR